MKKTLLAIALCILPQTALADDSLLNTVKPYLDPYGVIREEFRKRHYLFTGEANLFYNRKYVLPNGMNAVEQYLIYPSGKISSFPIVIGIDNIWFDDLKMNGINGDEERFKEIKEDST